MIIIDLMEYSSDALAQAAFVSNATAFTSQYPTLNDTYVKATTHLSTDYWQYYSTDSSKSLTGDANLQQWLSTNAGGGTTNQRFHIDLGSEKVITRIYYQNSHHNGGYTTGGVENFTFWGSNTVGDFNDLVYINNGTWVPLTIDQSTMDIHVSSNISDPKYILVTNTTAYRYYAIKCADNYGNPDYMGFRRLELQSGPDLQVFSEATLKTEGSYALKGIFTTTALSKTLTRTVAVASTIDLSGKTLIKFNIRASRTGSNIKIGIHNIDGTTTEYTPNIAVADTYQTEVWDISAVANTAKNAIDKVIVTIMNADANNTFYIDNMYGEISNYLGHRGRNRFIFSEYSLG